MLEINQNKVSRGVCKLSFSDVKRSNQTTYSPGVSLLFALRQLRIDLIAFQTIKSNVQMFQEKNLSENHISWPTL